MRKLLFGLLVMVQVCLLAGESRPTTISVNSFYDPNTPEKATTRRLLDLMLEDKNIHITKWGGITLPGGAGKASLMMAIAGGTAPDVGQSWFHIIRNEIKQQFLYPLNEWVCKDYDPENPMAWDKNGNGIIDDDETCWEPWKRVPYLWRRVAMADGKLYGIPETAKYYQGMVFRTDMVQNAGLNPNKPPQTWDELKEWCRKLSNNRPMESGSAKGQRGIALSAAGYLFLPWIQSAGGEPIIQIRKSPKTGKSYTFAQDAEKFITPDGENLETVEPEWRANFDSPESLAAAKLYHDLFHERWEAEDGEVFYGVGRVNTGQRGESPMELLAKGEIAMTVTSVNDLSQLGNNIGLNPDVLSWFPIPAKSKDEGRPTVQIQTHYIVAYEQLSRMNKVDRDRVWKVMTSLADIKTRENSVREKVLAGLAGYVTPDELREFGYEEYINDIPENIINNYKRIANGEVASFTEPWSGYWLTMDMALNRQVLSLLMIHSDFDYTKALQELTITANSGVMFETPREILDQWRPAAFVIMSIIVIVVAVFVFFIIKTQLKNKLSGNANANVHKAYLPYLLVLPALALIALWKYYPLLRGMVMAFQDYRITGESTFTGLDNFIILARDKSFWMSLVRTCYFVFLNMILAFTAPILLAILLTEIPKFKIFFRTIFFLPQMTSGLVIALLWKLMYSPTPQGFFNQLIAYLNYLPFINIEPQTWLQDPKLAMVCCVVPTVWASMGMASLIYLAALHSIPPDYYEAADLDGAGIWKKFWTITVPTILPLIIINFVGAFIGTFQNMGNIFLMTFGGPGEATTVTGLKIWMEAYNNLRFSMATSMAWVLGSLLIGFTYIQIRFLSKVEYKKAKSD